ncbi:MAG TPA: heavy-metal-associated domain-containing protein [Kaistia sp.]|nr:heavy-metal-associated domain-containing protein [Kaistia sp.]
MLIFTVPDMSCGHCASTIGKAARAAAPSAEVKVDLASKRVEIAGEADQAAVVAAIRAAGYEPAAG